MSFRLSVCLSVCHTTYTYETAVVSLYDLSLTDIYMYVDRDLSYIIKLSENIFGSIFCLGAKLALTFVCFSFLFYFFCVSGYVC